MAWFTNFARSTVGAKIIMAVTGLGLVGFVLAHMAGNLLIFSGTPDTINAYAQGLKDLGPLLWVARIGLIVFAVLHITSFLRLNARNSAARPQGYAQTKWQQAPVASRYMRLSGIVVFAFIVYHLLHFTAGVVTVDPDGLRLATEDALGRHHVYNMVVSGFANPIVSGAYIIAMILLGLHINHGASSVFQTLGLKNSKYNGLIEKLGPGLSALIVVGNCSIPIAVLSGIIKGVQG